MKNAKRSAQPRRCEHLFRIEQFNPPQGVTEGYWRCDRDLHEDSENHWVRAQDGTPFVWPSAQSANRPEPYAGPEVD